VLVIGTVVMSLGMAPVFTIGNEMIITAAPPERAGAASALSATSSELSRALGIALFGSIGTVVYRAGLSASMSDAVPSDTAREALATLGGAVAIAHSVPGLAGDSLLHAAQPRSWADATCHVPRSGRGRGRRHHLGAHPATSSAGKRPERGEGDVQSAHACRSPRRAHC